MGRQPSFNRERVLNKATDVFLKRGFQGTTIKDITQATGLQPGSIYSAFENKTGLYTEVIQHYTDKQVSILENVCEKTDTHIGAIRAFFDSMGKSISSNSGDGHCLLVRGLFEVPESQKELRYYVQLKIHEIESRIYALLVKAKENNEIVPEENPIELARFLMTLLFGHRVLAQLKPSESTVNNTIERVFKIIEASR